MEKRTNLDKLNNLLKKAKEDLKIWLYYANVKSIKEFKLKEKELQNNSFHKIDDVKRQIEYIKKLNSKIKELKKTTTIISFNDLVKEKINELNSVARFGGKYWIEGRSLYCNNWKIQSFKKSEILELIEKLMIAERV